MIHYKVIGCSNPAGQSGIDYACCRATHYETLTLMDVCKYIEFKNTFTRADIVSTLTAFTELALQKLLEGRKIDFKKGNLATLGLLEPVLKSRCFRQTAIQAEGFNPSGYITGGNVHMRISPRIKEDVNMLAKVKRDPSDLMA